MCLRKTQPKRCSCLVLLWEIWNFYHLLSLCLHISGWFFVHVTRIFLKRKKNGRNLGTQGIVILNECYIKYLFCCYLESNALKTLVAVLGWQGDQVVSALDSQSGGPSSKCRSDFTSCICLSSIPRSTPWPRLWKADWLPSVIVVFNLIIDVFLTLYLPNYLSGVLVNFNSGQKKF